MAAYAPLGDLADSCGAIVGVSLAVSLAVSLGYRVVYGGTALLVCLGTGLLLVQLQLKRQRAPVVLAILTPQDGAVPQRDVAVGFLYHPPSGKVLLHLRSTDKPPNAGKWAFFGGRAEPEDGGDLLITWCREMREELGVTLDPACAVSLRHGTDDNGRRWHDLYAEWPSLDTAFVLTEGERFAWFTLAEALRLPDLAGYAREDLVLFRARLEAGLRSELD